ncbi:DoxX family protein [Propionibacteriaceae bacterium G1746]
MSLIPDPWWPSAALALVVLVDALLTAYPPKFVRDCLDGVHFPREWWWVLVVVKPLAVAGLVVGLWWPGVALAANVGVIAYFVCAAVAHVRARFTGQTFWGNCVGMLVLSVAALVLAFGPA